MKRLLMICILVGLMMPALVVAVPTESPPWISGSATSTLCFELSIAYSGTPPEETPPWLTSTFDDEGSPGDVDLTLTATNLSESEFVSCLHFDKGCYHRDGLYVSSCR